MNVIVGGIGGGDGGSCRNPSATTLAAAFAMKSKCRLPSVLADRPCSGFLTPSRGIGSGVTDPRHLAVVLQSLSRLPLKGQAAPPWTCSRTAPGLQLNPANSRWHDKDIASP